MDMLNLIDIQNIKHPRVNKYSYKSKALTLKSRIVVFLLIKHVSIEPIWSVFTWRHACHIGVPTQSNGSHIGVWSQSFENWTLFLCKKMSFVSVKQYGHWLHEWKRSVQSSIAHNRTWHNKHCTVYLAHMF